MTRLLVSARDVGEALAAARAGADLVDLKDPAAGALGGLAPEHIAAIVRALRAEAPDRQVSATIGDFAVERRDEILARIDAVAASGVDFVKVGIERSRASARGACELLRALAACGAPVVPVLLADVGMDGALVATALAARAFPAVMLDLAGKRTGSLVQRLPPGALAGFVARVHASGRLAGLAGALRLEDVPALRALAPDFAGFRSAVCVGGRAGSLDEARVAALRAGLAASAPRPGGATRLPRRLQHADEAGLHE